MTKQYRALTGLSLRKSPDPKKPAYEEWLSWPEGAIFTPPAHFNVERGLERGIIEEVVS